MKKALLLFVLSVCCAYGQSPQRLIAFNETYRKWMSQEEVLQLEPTSDNFMDITNFPDPVLKQLKVDPIPNKITQKILVNALSEDIEIENLRATITKLGTFYTRYYNSDTAKQASQWLFQQYQDFSAFRDDITIEYFEHSWKMPSIIARIKGEQGDAGATRIILGAHEDSIGTTTTGQAPGADDDGSGTATVLEVFRVLAQSGFKPRRTIEFHSYSGEEGGLLGSQAIAKTYQSLDIVVESMLQLDMTMYGKNETEPFGVITDYVSPELSEFLRLLLGAYTAFPHTNTKCGYGCSDHASWTKYGYRAAFPFEAIFSKSDPNIHSPRDTVSTLNFHRGHQLVKVALGYVIEMAGGSLSVNKS